MKNILNKTKQMLGWKLNYRAILKPGLVLGLILVLASGVINPGSHFAQAATANVPPPTSVGSSDAWTVNAGTKADAVSSNDGDTTYISSSTKDAAQTFSFPGAGLPVGSTINSVTLSVMAKKGAGGLLSPQIRLLAENGSSQEYDGLGHALNDDSAYSQIDWTMTTNPLTSAAWTLSEVNAWTTKFGVVKSDLGLFGETAKVTKVALSVDYTAHPSPAANPSLPSPTCGLDIALVLDNSGSIGGNLATMKTSFNNFVNSLLPGTPTEFSVTYFDGSADYALQTFSSSAPTVTAAISGVPSSSGQTNWEDALIKANATFDPRPGSAHPNLIIFSSDGVPNLYNVYDSQGNITGTAGTGGLTVDPDALDAAVAQANIIKNAGTRIITLGIGSSVDQANLEAISGSGAYYSAANFSDLPTVLDGIAGDLCGSTISVTKIIDQDGSLQTTNDQSAGANWEFNVGGTTKTTDSQGKTPSVKVNAGTYSVSETAKSGFNFVGASCTGATNNGTTTAGSITGLQVNSDDIVSCTFYNTPASTPVPGCMDPKATNYNPNATVSDSSCQYATQCPLVIDRFSEPYDAITYETVNSSRLSHFVATSGLGGELDVFHTITKTGSSSGSEYTDTVTGAFNISNGVLAKSTVLLVWDGQDNNANTINYTGLSGVDLSAGGQRTKIDFSYVSDFISNNKVILTFRIYTNSGNASEAVVELYGASNSVLNGSVLLSSFTPILGTGADMSNVGAVSLLIDATSRTAIDFQLDSIELPCVSNGGGGGGGGTSPYIDVAVQKSVDDSTPDVDQNITYILTVSNLGTATATNVTATETLPSTLTLISATSSDGSSYNDLTGVWSVGDLPPSATSTLTIVAKVNSGTAGQTIGNTVTVTGGPTTDTNTSNNSASASAVVNSPGGGGGGCVGNCGGGGGGGGGTSSFIPATAMGGGSPVPPAGQVLGITMPGPLPATPEVLGTATLPRTGASAMGLIFPILLVLAILDRKFKLV